MNYSIPLLCYVPSAKCQVSGVKLMRPDASAALVELIPAERKGMLGCFVRCQVPSVKCQVSGVRCQVNETRCFSSVGRINPGGA